MNRTALVAIVMLLGTAVVRAEDAARSYLERAAGHWHSTTRMGDEKGFGIMAGVWSEDKSALLADERIVGLDFSAPWHGRCVMQQGEKPNTMKLCYAAEDGTQFEDDITFTQEGKVLTGTGKRKGFAGDRKPISADVTVTSSDENVIVWKMRNYLASGEKTPDLTLKFTRVNHDDLPE